MTLPDHPLIREAVITAWGFLKIHEPTTWGKTAELVLEAALPKLEQYFREQFQVTHNETGGNPPSRTGRADNR